jgi:hypothetical protein
VDVARVRPALLAERERLRLGPDEHRDRTGTLRRLTGGPKRVTGDIARDDERAAAAYAAGAYPVGRRHERRGTGVARVLQLVDAAARPDAEELVHEDADRLRVIDARLGRDQQHADPGLDRSAPRGAAGHPRSPPA